MDEELFAKNILNDILRHYCLIGYETNNSYVIKIHDYIKHTFVPSVNEIIQNAINLFNITILMESCVIKHLDCCLGTYIVNDTFMNDYLHRFKFYKRTIDEYCQILCDYIYELSQKYCKYGNLHCSVKREVEGKECGCRPFCYRLHNVDVRLFSILWINNRIEIHFYLTKYYYLVILRGIDGIQCGH